MPKPPPIDFEDIGKQYGKPDMERLGIFIDDGYMNGAKYVSPNQGCTYFKGKNMYPGGRKFKNGTQHGYFDSEFRRLFEGEGVNWRKPKEKKGAKPPAKTGVFMPCGPSKQHATPGDFFGCFEKNVEYFSNLKKPVPKYVHEKGNFITRPGKQGGPGYPDICMSKYPEHMPDPYNPKPKKGLVKKGPPLVTMIFPKPYFDPNPYIDPSGKIGPTYVRPKPSPYKSRGTWIPNGPAKWQGGMHAGCFDHYPEWIEPKKRKPEKKVYTSPFYPQSMAMKTMFTTPILHKQMDTSICQDNYHNYEATYVKHLLD